MQGRNCLLFILDAQLPIKIFLTLLNYLCKFSAYLGYVSDTMINLALPTACQTVAPEDTNIILCPHFKRAPLCPSKDRMFSRKVPSNPSSPFKVLEKLTY